MKKPVISGWVLSFGSEKALLQAVRVLVLSLIHISEPTRH